MRKSTALLLIDVVNDLDFPESTKLREQALPMARNLARLKARAHEHQLPCIYVNDNFGQWKSDFRAIVAHCLRPESKGIEVTRMLQPKDDDYFVLKPMHSGFYQSNLEVLLDYLKVNTLILTGIAANICVLFTANDAYMRDYHLFVPRDCVASNTQQETDYSLEQMRQLLKAEIRPSTKISFDALGSRDQRRSPGAAAKLLHRRSRQR